MPLGLLDEAKTLAAAVDGWLSDDEGELLFNLAKRCTGRGSIVEVGSWKGKSTIWLGKGSVAGNKVKVWAVDPHTGSAEHHELFGKVWTFDQFRENIAGAGLEGIVFPLVVSSQEAALRSIDPVELIFIDGSHDYDAVKSDFEAWFPRVVEGGTMAFHDSTYGEGPRRVVEENLYRSRSFRLVRLTGSITHAQKVRRNSAKDHLANVAAMYVTRTPGRIQAIVPELIRRAGRRLAGVS
jgi:MMP 1-O-methyltransferase